MYFNLVKMRYAGWQHKLDFNRKIKHSLSEIFQDMVAFYLKKCLPKEYEIEIEAKNTKPKPRVDIAVKKDKKFIFLIETKTNIGFARPNNKDTEPFRKFNERINELSKKFRVPKKRIIYLLEDYGNSSKSFSSMYWDKLKDCPMKHPEEFPYCKFYPLFHEIDPNYWDYDPKQTKIPELSDKIIWRKAESNIVTPFEEVVKMIIK